VPIRLLDPDGARRTRRAEVLCGKCTGSATVPGKSIVDTTSRTPQSHPHSTPCRVRYTVGQLFWLPSGLRNCPLDRSQRAVSANDPAGLPRLLGLRPIRLCRVSTKVKLAVDLLWLWRSRSDGSSA